MIFLNIIFDLILYILFFHLYINLITSFFFVSSSQLMDTNIVNFLIVK